MHSAASYFVQTLGEEVAKSRRVNSSGQIRHLCDGKVKSSFYEAKFIEEPDLTLTNPTTGVTETEVWLEAKPEDFQEGGCFYAAFSDEGK